MSARRATAGRLARATCSQRYARPLWLRAARGRFRGSVLARECGAAARATERAPRLPAPRRAGAALLASRGLDAVRRPSAPAPDGGFDLHSVRDYQQGESLGRCTGRRPPGAGTLMVKELEDAPHDEVAVLLDARTSRGRPGRTAFDVQVRAAGSILRVARRCAVAAGVLTSPLPPPESATWPRSTASGGSRSSCSRTAEPTRHGAARAVPRPRCLGSVAGGRASWSSRARWTPGWSMRFSSAAFARRRRSRRPRRDVRASGRRKEHPPANPRCSGCTPPESPVAALGKGDDLAAKLSGFEEAYAAHG